MRKPLCLVACSILAAALGFAPVVQAANGKPVTQFKSTGYSGWLYFGGESYSGEVGVWSGCWDEGLGFGVYLYYDVFDSNGNVIAIGDGCIATSALTGEVKIPGGGSLVLDIDTSDRNMVGPSFWQDGPGGLIHIEWTATDDWWSQFNGTSVSHSRCLKYHMLGLWRTISSWATGSVLGIDLSSAWWLSPELRTTKSVEVMMVAPSCQQ